MKIERIQYPNSNVLSPGQAARTRPDGSQTETTEAVDFDGRKREGRQDRHEESKEENQLSSEDQPKTDLHSQSKKNSGIDVVA